MMAETTFGNHFTVYARRKHGHELEERFDTLLTEDKAKHIARLLLVQGYYVELRDLRAGSVLGGELFGELAKSLLKEEPAQPRDLSAIRHRC